MDLHETAIESPASPRAPASPAKSSLGRRLYAACLALVIASGAAAAPTASAPPADPGGEWRVAKGVATIRVVDCDGQYWGVVAWEQNPGIDEKNPDPAKRGRPTLGMPILLGMKQSAANEWSGEIYNSEDGHIYSAKISLPDPDTLQVQGCLFGFLCGGEKWSRVITESTIGAGPVPPKAPTGPSGARKPSSSAPSASSTAGRPAHPPAAVPPSAQASAQPPSPQTQPAEDICLGLVGPPGSAHQRGLK